MAVETLRDLWERNARLTPDALVCVQGDRRRSHAEFLERAYRLANALADRGVRAGDRVSILARNCAESLEALAASHVLGSIAAPLDFRLAAPELARLLADSAPAVSMFGAEYGPSLAARPARAASPPHRIAIGGAADRAERYEDVIAAGNPTPPPGRPGAQDIAHLLYTAGTTGRAKGVMRSH